MINRKQVKEVKTIMRDEVVSVTCDFCGREDTRAIPSCESVEWDGNPLDSFAVFEVGIFYKTGDIFPEGGSVEYESFHMCPKCWEEKFVPWAKSRGATPTVSERDY